MKNELLAILLCGIAVVACNEREAKVAEKSPAGISISTDSDDARDGDASVNIKANMESGEVALALPGGLEGKVKIPGGLESDTKFDLDGVGRYPGSKLVSVDIAGTRKDAEGSGTVVLGFTAPAAPDAVAGWYEKALIAKGRTTARTGNIVTSETDDGDPMVIAVEDAGRGMSRGRVTFTGKASD